MYFCPFPSVAMFYIKSVSPTQLDRGKPFEQGTFTGESYPRGLLFNLPPTTLKQGRYLESSNKKNRGFAIGPQFSVAFLVY